MGALGLAALAEVGDEGGQFASEGGGEAEGRVRDGVREGEDGGVEGLAVEEGGFVGCDEGAPAVHVVADDGVAEVGEVDADLVGSAGFEFELDEGEGVAREDGGGFEGRLLRSGGVGPSFGGGWRGAGDGMTRDEGEAFADAVEGEGVFAELVVADDLLLAEAFFLGGVGADGEVDGVGERFDPAVDEGEVAFVDAAVFELVAEFPVGLVLFGEDDAAGGVAVEAMNDAGAGEFLADGGESAAERAGVLEVPGEGVDERAGEVRASGVDDDVGLLVEDDEVLVLEEDVERDFFGDGAARGRGRDDDGDDVAGVDLLGGFGAAVVDGDFAGVDEPLELVSAHEGDAVGEVAVESFVEVALEGEGDGAEGIVVAIGFGGGEERVGIDLAAGKDERAGGDEVVGVRGAGVVWRV